MKRIFTMFAVLIVAITLSGCLSPRGADVSDQKTYAEDMAASTLTDLYKIKPEAESIINNASGYIVYNTFAIDYFFLSTENGWGVAISKNGDNTVLKIITVGIGPGLGFANMRNILIFDNEIDYKAFIAGGWGLNAKIAAVARFSEGGKAQVAGEANITNGAKMYKIGRRGLIAEANLDISKSWVNSSLNK